MNVLLTTETFQTRISIRDNEVHDTLIKGNLFIRYDIYKYTCTKFCISWFMKQTLLDTKEQLYSPA